MSNYIVVYKNKTGYKGLNEYIKYPGGTTTEMREAYLFSYESAKNISELNSILDEAHESAETEIIQCDVCRDEHWVITHEGRVNSPCPACGGGERFKKHNMDLSVAKEILTKLWGKPQMESKVAVDNFLKLRALEAMEQYCEVKLKEELRTYTKFLRQHDYLQGNGVYPLGLVGEYLEYIKQRQT